VRHLICRLGSPFITLIGRKIKPQKLIFLTAPTISNHGGRWLRAGAVSHRLSGTLPFWGLILEL
jgi:hypothetical protein